MWNGQSRAVDTDVRPRVGDGQRTTSYCELLDEACSVAVWPERHTEWYILARGCGLDGSSEVAAGARQERQS